MILTFIYIYRMVTSHVLGAATYTWLQQGNDDIEPVGGSGVVLMKDLLRGLT